MFFFFFKQKTAYEMRISDWSSDVCSSDLALPRDPPRPPQRRAAHRPPGRPRELLPRCPELGRRRDADARLPARSQHPGRAPPARPGALPLAVLQGREDRKSTRLNSSLMRISYAVFCLKKKKYTNPHNHQPYNSKQTQDSKLNNQNITHHSHTI